MPEANAAVLPGTLRVAVGQEFARALRPPYETLITVAANAALMSSAWFFLPKGLKGDVFTLHGSLAFALVLATWISAWVGILFPYHPVPLRYRWEHRRPLWRMLGRWLTLLVTPYAVVPALAVVLMVPSLLVWGFTSLHGLSRKLPDNDLGWGVWIACAVAVLCSFGSHRLAAWLIRRRRAALLEFLADPARG